MPLLSKDAPSTDAGVTELLERLHGGDEGAWDEICARMYDELRRIASAQLRAIRGDPSWRGSPTSLVSEAWIRLAKTPLGIENRQHLASLMARAMRFVLVDEARRALADKRIDPLAEIPIDDVEIPFELSIVDLLALDTALSRLSDYDRRLGKVVELIYFGGFQGSEVAVFLGTTERTVRRDWRRAQAFLVKCLQEERRAPENPQTGTTATTGTDA